MSDDIGQWLTRHGLGEHAGVFATHGLDWDVLRDLSERDLKELGLSLGDRKRLQKAILALPPAGAGGTLDTIPRAAAPAADAERRQITVMFVDLVDSTPLAERLDPEEMRDVLRAFHAACAAAVELREGHIARYLGDGVVVYFGYPQAHEDDAARAVQAGLGIVANVGTANERLESEHGVRLRVRVGVHTGLVVVGEVGAGPTRDRDAIVGDAPNIASRLQAAAPPDSVVIGDATQRLIEGLFDLDDLGPHELKGVSHPVRLYRVRGESGTADRFDARVRRGMTPLIGREAELEMLRQRWLQVRDGEMRCVLLVGDAGIGKSRILRALRDSLDSESHETLLLFCSPYHHNSAFWPVLDWLRRSLGLDPRAAPTEARDKLASIVDGLELDMAEAMPLLLAFLDLPGDARYGAVDTAATSFKAQLLGVLVRTFGALARRQPLLLLIEDAHWIDPSTLELLRQVQEQLATARLLLLITARPEFRPDWTYPQFVQINLDRLSRRDRMAMVDRLTGGKALPDFVLEQIVAKTDGIPLFVEELTKAVLEGGTLRSTGGRYELAGPFETIAIPDTLQGSLMARLDRLDPEAREVAQVGATIGRAFSFGLVSRVTGRSDEDLQAALEQLVAAEIILPAPGPAPNGAWPGGVHAFRHALIQEAAYQSLLLARRRQYHAAVAEALTAHFPDIATRQPEMIAQHWSAANQSDVAIDWWLRAGERATSRSAYAEACIHLQRGIDLAERLPDDERTRSRRMLPLLLARGLAEFKAMRREAIATARACAVIARRERLPDALVAAAVAFADAELYLGVPGPESVASLDEALMALGPEETVGRCRVVSRLAKALLSTGVTERGHDVLREVRPMADRLRDDRSIYEILSCELMPNGAPPVTAAEIPQRRRSLRRMWEIAEELGGNLTVEATARCGAAYLEIGDIDGFELAMRKADDNALNLRHDIVKWSAASGRAVCAILRGDFDLAERFSCDAVDVLTNAAVDFPLGVHGMQMFTIRREQGRLAEVAPLVKRFVKESADSLWRPGLMLIASDLGFEPQARKTFAAMAESRFALPVDSKHTVTLAYLAEVCTRLDDDRHAEWLYDLLVPYRDLAVVAPTVTLCCGAAARYLGMLAGTMRDWDAAAEHFEAALVMDEHMRAWPWLAHSRHEYARVLLARGRPQDMVRAGELRASALAAAERMKMGRLRQRIVAS